MALSNVTYTANGSTTIFVVSFGYLQESHVTVTIDGVVTTAYTFTVDGNIEFTVAPLNLSIVYITRDSDISQILVAYGDGSNLTQEDLNNDANQSIFLQQETRDKIDTINTENAAVIGRLNQHDIDITGNDTDISTNVTGIGTNTTNIATNSAAITNVDNTSDVDKPISTSTQTALDLKVNATAITNVDNTSDVNKPVSTATQTALDLKLDQTSDVELTIQEIATPSTPATGYKSIYPKADGNIYTLNDAGVETVVGGSVNGVENVGSSTDNAVAKFDSTTGKIVQNSKVIIDDAGRISQPDLGDSVHIGVDAGIADDLTTNGIVAIGKDSAKASTTGSKSISIGDNCNPKSTGGSYNTFVGADILATNGLAGGGGNSIFGGDSGTFLFSNYSNNSIFGKGSGKLIYGNTNTILGAISGTTSTSASGLILIGHGVNAPTATTSNHLNIGNIIKGDTSTGDLDIISTTALGLPKGTEAQRPTGADGDIRFNSDSNSYEGYSSGAWGDLGGGSGGLDTFYTENFEKGVGASNFTSGNNATYDNGGTIAGTLSDDVTTEINGATSLKYVQASGSLNDFIKSPSIPIFKKQQNNTNGAIINYTYDGADGDIQVVLYDDTGSEVLTNSTNVFKSSSRSQRLTVQYPVGGSSVVLNWGIKVLVENIGAILVVDDVELTTDPFVSKEMLDTQFFEEDSPSMTTSNGDLRWGSIVGTGSKLLSYDDSNGHFVANRLCTVNVSYSGYSGVGAVSLNIKKNTTVIMTEAAPTNTQASPAVTIELEKGDYLVLNVTNPLLAPKLTIYTQAATNQIVAYNSRNAENSTISVHTGNGYGSTNIMIPRFSTTQISKGNAITYTDSATLGNSFTINEDGIYFISMNYAFTGAQFGGISLNSTQLTTSIDVITANDRLAEGITQANTFSNNACWSGPLSKGDVIRGHTSSQTMTGDSQNRLTISKIGTGDLLGVPVARTAYIKDVKASGTDGGTFTSGAWRTRDLNDLSGDTEFISLATNQFTLQAGKYDIDVSAPAYQVDNHKAKLYNITGAVDYLIGQANRAGSSSVVRSNSNIIGSIIITTATTFEIQHYCGSTQSGRGFGNNIDFSVDEVYTQVKITKIS